MADAAYQFLPWTRRGLAATLTNADPAAGQLPARATFNAGIVVATPGGSSSAGPVPIALYGPGDLAGIDQRLIVRREPRANTANFEPNHMAAIEFDPSDLPWAFTPAAAGSDGRLRPWLVLVVLDVAIVGRPQMTGGPLPTVHVPAEVSQRLLPDLAESWAWAHAQVATTDKSVPVDPAGLAARPELNLSRLVCPRYLEPNTRYVACVVPAFAAGVQRGLGAKPDPTLPMQPAWNWPDPGAMVLPVYTHWEFATGPAGDFETLCRKLQPMPCPPGIGQTRMDLQQAGTWLEPPAADPSGPGLDYADHATHVQGAFRDPALSPQTLDQVPPYLQDGLKRRLNQPAALQQAAGAADAPPLGPAIYGEWHVARHTVDPSVGPAWFAQLNLDPRHRVTASLGGDVCRENQEAFMQAAWEQVGAVLAANAMLNRTMLATLAADSLYRRTVVKLPDDRLTQLAAPALARVRQPGGTLTMQAAVAQTSLLDSTLGGAMRRFTSPRRPALRAATRQARVATGFTSTLLTSLAAGRADVDPRRVQPDGIAGLRGADAVAPGAAAGRTSLAGIGLAYEVPTSTLTTIQASSSSIAGRDFAATPLVSVVREDLPTRGVLTQDHFDAIRDGLRVLQQASPDNAVLATSDIATVITTMTSRSAEIANNPTMMTVDDLGIDIGVLRVDTTHNVVNSTSLRTGQIRVVLALPAGESASASLSERIGGLRLVPLAVEAHEAPVALQADAAGRFELSPAGSNRLTQVVGQHSSVTLNRRTTATPLATPTPTPTPAPAAAAVSQVAGALGQVIPSLVLSADIVAAVKASALAAVAGQTIAADASVVVPFPLAAAATALRTRLDPTVVAKARLSDQLTLGDGRDLFVHLAADLEVDGLLLTPHHDRIMAAPDLPAPTYQYLQKLSTERLLPGVGRLATPNLMTLVETNPAFVEAFLVGLNHEFGRELLWRTYPTDRRCTPFRHFWPRFDGNPDIPLIHTWSPFDLGRHTVDSGPGGQIVVLLRGELFRRYPNTVIYAQRATRVGGKLVPAPPTAADNTVRQAEFAGRFDPDFTFVGLKLTTEELNKDDGWYIVLQEQPTEPRFGLDEADPDTSTPEALQLAWARTGTAPGTHLRLADPANRLVTPPPSINPLFSRNSAHISSTLLRKQFRMTFHSKWLERMATP